jgi:His-Xaa-Ser system protein HxsD
MQPDIQTDILGDCARIWVARAIYSDVAVFKAAYWATDRFYLFIDADGADRLSIEIRSKDDTSSDLSSAAREFCNSLVDFRLRDIVNAETGSIRDSLVRRAFQEGQPKAGLSGAVSNERHLDQAK